MASVVCPVRSCTSALVIAGCLVGCEPDTLSPDEFACQSSECDAGATLDAGATEDAGATIAGLLVCQDAVIDFGYSPLGVSSQREITCLASEATQITALTVAAPFLAQIIQSGAAVTLPVSVEAGASVQLRLRYGPTGDSTDDAALTISAVGRSVEPVLQIQGLGLGPNRCAAREAIDPDCDGVEVLLDCDPNDAALGSRAFDGDCDGVLVFADCDDANPNSANRDGDGDCDGVPTELDCNDDDVQLGPRLEDADCDGLTTAEDCDDNDQGSTSITADTDCDGQPNEQDCAPIDPLLSVYNEARTACQLYAVGGTLQGLVAGTSLTLRNHDGQDLVLTQNGPFAFEQSVAPGVPYAVTVLLDPTLPAQSCTVTAGSGTVTWDVDDVSVECEQSEFTATVTANAGGSVGFERKSGNRGDRLELTVSADEGQRVASVTGCEGELSEGVYTTGPLAADCEIAVAFERQMHTVTTQGGVGGALDPTTRSIAEGETASFLVVPDNQYALATIEGCGGALDGATYTTGTVTAPCTVVATFLPVHTVNTTLNDGGSIDQTSIETIHGTAAVFSIERNTGYEIASVSGCGGSLSGSTYTTAAVSAPCTVTVTFAEIVCDAGFYLDGNTCLALTACGAEEYEATAPAAKADRVCDVVTECTVDEYEDAAPTETSDRVCETLAICDESEYETAAPTETANRTCASITACEATEYQTAAPTSTTDRVCATLTVCAESEYQSTAPTATTDRICTALSTCEVTEYEASAAAETADRVCATITECEGGEYEASAPDETTDRVCETISTCAAGTYLSEAATETSDVVCETFGEVSAELEGGDEATYLNPVTVTAEATGADEIYITNDPDCSSEGSWVSHPTNLTEHDHTLGQTGEAATVYVKLRDSVSGNETECVSVDIDHVVAEIIVDSGDNVLCADETPTITVSANGGAAYTYEVFVNALSLYLGPNADTNLGALSDGDEIVVSATHPTYGWTTVSETMTVDVYAVTNTIGGAQSIALADDPAALTNIGLDAGGAATSAIQWQVADAEAVDFENIDGATSATYDPSNMAATGVYRRIYTVGDGTGTCAHVSNNVTVTVAALALVSNRANNTGCDGDSVIFTHSLAGASDNTWTFGADVTDTGIASLTTTIDGEKTLSVEVSDDGLFGTAEASLDFVGLSVANTTITAPGTTSSVGAWDPDTITGDTSTQSNGSLGYQWESSTSGPDAGFTSILSATSKDYDPPPISTTTYYRRVSSVTHNAIQCDTYSDSITLSVE